MFFYNYGYYLKEYENQLNQISTKSSNYKQLLLHVVENFFNNIKEKDLIDFFRNLNKENIAQSQIEKDAFSYLMLLTVKKYKTPADFLNKIFPNYIEIELLPKSSWFIIRMLYIFIAWFVKPKLRLCDSPDAKQLLDSFRDIKQRIENSQLDVHSEMTDFKGLSFIIEKFLKKKSSLKIYIPISEETLLEKNQAFYEKQVDCLTKYELREVLDLNNLMRCNAERLNPLNKEDNYFNKNNHNLNEGIKKRLVLLGSHAKATHLNINLNSLTSESKQLLSLNIGQVQFFYEKFYQNFAKQDQQLYYGNISDLYEILNKLGEVLYQDKNLFFHSIIQASSIEYIIGLSKTLNTLEELAKSLQSIAKKIDPRTLEEDILKLSKYILLYLSVIKENLKLYTEKTDFIMRNVSYVSYRNSSSNSSFDIESDISEVMDSDLEREENNNSLGCDDLVTMPFDNSVLSKELSDSEPDSAYSDEASQFSSSNEQEGNNEQGVYLLVNNFRVNHAPTFSSFHKENKSSIGSGSCQDPVTATRLGMRHA